MMSTLSSEPLRSLFGRRFAIRHNLWIYKSADCFLAHLRLRSIFALDARSHWQLPHCWEVYQFSSSFAGLFRHLTFPWWQEFKLTDHFDETSSCLLLSDHCTNPRCHHTVNESRHLLTWYRSLRSTSSCSFSESYAICSQILKETHARWTSCSHKLWWLWGKSSFLILVLQHFYDEFKSNSV